MEIVPPINYDSSWLWLGILAMTFICLVILVIFFITRHKEPRTIANLKPQNNTKDYEAIRRKYLQIIAEIRNNYDAKAISARLAHQQISLAARQFVFEFKGIPAHNLTLTDLKKSSALNDLSQLIGDIYPPEFDRIDRGSVAESCDNAKGVIEKWR
jgi:hypothetical protein